MGTWRGMLLSLLLLLSMLVSVGPDTAAGPARDVARAPERQAASVLTLAGIPPGWCLDRYNMDGDAQRRQALSVLDPAGTANLIASSELVRTSLTSRGYARAQGALLEQDLTGYRELSLTNERVLGSTGYVRTFTWEPSGTDPVLQLQGYVARGGVGYVVTVTTTVPRFEADEQLYRTLLGSVTVAGKDAAAAPSLPRCSLDGDDQGSGTSRPDLDML